MPFQSSSQQKWAFATGQPFATRWAKQTNFKRLPYKKVKKDIVGTVSMAVAPHGPGGLMSAPGMGGTKRTRKKAFTVQQLEAFVCSPHYDPDTAGAIARRVPALPSLKGEQLSPGITRIHGNLCNVHGRYGRCPGASVALPPKPRKGRTPRTPKADRAAQHATNRTATLTGAGYSAADQASLAALRNGAQPANVSSSLRDKGLIEQASDGSYRMTASGRALMTAADQGDAGRAHDIASGAADRLQARRARQTAAAKRQQDAAGKRAVGQMDRELSRRQRADAQAKRAAAQAKKKPSGGTRKQPAPQTAEKPLKPSAPKRRTPHASAPHVGGVAGASANKKPIAAPKPTKAHATANNQASVRDAMAQSDQGLAPGGFDNLIALGGGKEPDQIGATGLIGMGMAERGTDGTLRLTSAGRAAIAAANRGDAKAAIDVISRASEPKKVATKAQSDEEKAMFAKMGGGGGGGSGGGKSGGGGKSSAWPKGPGGKRVPTKANAQAALQSYQKRSNLASEKKRDAIKLDAHASMAKRRGDTAEAERLAAQAKQLHAESRALDLHKRAIPELRTIDRAGYHMSGDGKRLVPSKHSTTPKMKEAFTFRVFKDAHGRARWVAQSSTAYQDRDKEIVSTKALLDDCAFADRTHTYGPLRWWHVPGLDLGDCDFNAMHGKVLIESGTFRSPAIAQKVAQAADALEISLGFLHLPTEPDASGVFHHIRRFERSLVPRGKASNRFTAFRVKESPMFDPTKVAALKTLGFSDADITNLQTQAEATEKAADAQQVAYKSEDTASSSYPDLEINGIVYKAFPPKAAATAAPAEGSPEEEAAESPEDEAAEMDAGEAPDADDGGGLTLSPEDITAIGQAVSQALTTALGPLVSTMDLTNKIGSHMDELKGMMGGYQTKKDATDAERAEQIATLQTALKATQDQLDELLGLQPAVTPRATQAPSTIINPFNPADNQLLQSVKDQVPPDMQSQYSNGFEDLKLKLFGP